ncbi:putative cysteine desulfurase [Rubripirellula obstinata]|uniref:cysteine desulfurase n=1 Tax=Rubripirellula obstinata TaxID=406547 RepID=A0A5B1CM74_9BACT|nr:aminotransferase class V-fold PLP-dependent enzyme [Rubripirellula obstinata]KAA1261381.1 putative cysteine desulfurase [Rubripirellula obstinata]
MTGQRRIYLDHAATSWPKHDTVLKAMDEFARDCGATAGRGAYQSSMAANQILAKTRVAIAKLIGAESTNCISFHSGGTAALNAAIHGLLRPGDHVVTTAAEHNSVLRPLHFLAKRDAIRLTIVPVDDSGIVDALGVVEAVEDDTRMVAVTAASNVTGAVQPISAIGKALKDRSALFLCDAAQVFGAAPINVVDSHIDVLASPGHKASGGPSGTGLLYVNERLHDEIEPSIQGGTGSMSESLDMPTSFPEKLEAGNLHVSGIAGWLTSLERLKLDRTEEHCRELSRKLHDGLRAIAGTHVFGKPGPIPIASVQIDGLSASDVAMILDSEFGIEVRSGLHCAALIHRCIGTADEGTVRISAGAETTTADIDAVIEAVTQIASSIR